MAALMIMGTASAVGKSTITLGLLRLLKREGYRTAPFKSLNVTDRLFNASDGLMSLGQAMQCEAAGLEPSVQYNPLVISYGANPSMIAFGKCIEGVRPADYRRLRRDFTGDISAAYRRLATEHDVVILEGAGSPVELNLLPDDFVNTAMAAIAGAKVILVGDISRGGIFAGIIGTLNLLEAEDRARVGGIIVNRFRGRRELFSDGVRILEERSGLPVLAVLQELKIDLEGEDLFSEASSAQSRDSRAYREEQYERLADALAEALDMKALRSLVLS